MWLRNGFRPSLSSRSSLHYALPSWQTHILFFIGMIKASDIRSRVVWLSCHSSVHSNWSSSTAWHHYCSAIFSTPWWCLYGGESINHGFDHNWVSLGGRDCCTVVLNVRKGHGRCLFIPLFKLLQLSNYPLLHASSTLGPVPEQGRWIWRGDTDFPNVYKYKCTDVKAVSSAVICFQSISPMPFSLNKFP